MIQLAREPLIQCINRHYDKLIQTQFRQLIQPTIDTHRKLTTDQTFAAIRHTVTERMCESITGLIQPCKRHHRPDRNKSYKDKNNSNSYNSYNDNINTNDNNITTSNHDSLHNNNNNNYQYYHNNNNNSDDHLRDDHHDNDDDDHDDDDDGDNTDVMSPTQLTVHMDTDDNHTGISRQSQTQTSHDQKVTHKKNRKSIRDRKRVHPDITIHTPQECTNPNCYQCATLNIVNLSGIPLTKPQVLLLSKGLSFVPTATNAKPAEFIREFNTFTEKAKSKLRRMINPPRPPRPNDEPALFRKPTQNTNTSTNPQNLGPKALEDAFEAARIEKAQIEQCPTLKHNLTRNERSALKELTSNTDLVINKADKGSTIGVRHRTDYIGEGLEHVGNTNTYIELHH